MKNFNAERIYAKKFDIKVFQIIVLGSQLTKNYVFINFNTTILMHSLYFVPFILTQWFYKPHIDALRSFPEFNRLTKVLLPLKATFKPLFCKVLLIFSLSPGKYGKEQKISFFSVVSRTTYSINFFLLFKKSLVN